MLSYRHSFHAGNFADVLKHIVLMELLAHMTKKQKPFDYIDTHAGAGRYRLVADKAEKKPEWCNGIGRLFESREEALLACPALAAYFSVVRNMNRQGGLKVYPGSPLIAASFLRERDRAWLYELHSSDFSLLEKEFGQNRQVRVEKQDGLKSLLALLPCQSRRAVVLIDPSYEIKTDYQAVVETAQKALAKMANTVIAIWYPVVERSRIKRMQKALEKLPVEDVHQYELGISGDDDDYGMTAAGLFVINPPWTLMPEMKSLLPFLAQQLTTDGELHYLCHKRV
ncbi:MAG: 23S rRNA (adenine(2030)-N(6))-methyltransferase RlmJ [Pseudomonadales bacterium]|nr:23S rRNA (adenine(2030)-N(6))-methyltransferase RlmJ [Pseudomonadales bacterium]